MRGRRPKPTAIKRLHGNPGKRSLNGSEPTPAAGLPECPPHLDAEARRQWGVIGPQLLELGLLTKIDGYGLAMLCSAWSRWLAADEKVKAAGLLVVVNQSSITETDAKGKSITTKSGGQVIANPALAIGDKARAEVFKLLGVFGMTPADRTRISATPPAGAKPIGVERRKR